MSSFLKLGFLQNHEYSKNIYRDNYKWRRLHKVLNSIGGVINENNLENSNTYTH